VTKKIFDTKYDFLTYEYDIGLLPLEELVEFPTISPICLPSSDDMLLRMNAACTGWGRLSEGGILPNVLQQVVDSFFVFFFSSSFLFLFLFLFSFLLFFSPFLSIF